MNFQFPDLFPKEKTDEITGDMRKVNEEIELGKRKELRKSYKDKRHNVPNWFGL